MVSWGYLLFAPFWPVTLLGQFRPGNVIEYFQKCDDDYDFDDEAFDVTSEEAKNIITNYLSNSLEHTWLQLTPRYDPNFKEINTDKLKSFLARRCWKKVSHAIRAVNQFTSLGLQADNKYSASSSTTLSTQSAESFSNMSRIAYDFDNEEFDGISEEAQDFISKLLVKQVGTHLVTIDSKV